MVNAYIRGTGSYAPKNIVKNDLVLVRIKGAVVKMNKAVIVVYQFKGVLFTSIKK